MSEVAMNLNIGGEPFRATPENTSLFMFIGKLASRNHIFLQTGEEDDRMAGNYVFSLNPIFEQMRDFMFKNGYPLHLNLREIAECDECAYQIAIDQIAKRDKPEDFVPDDWV